MIVKEFYKTRADGVSLYRTYSDANFVIHKIGTGEYYDEAIDIENALYTYEETDELIKQNNDVHGDISDSEFRQIVEEAL